MRLGRVEPVDVDRAMPVGRGQSFAPWRWIILKKVHMNESNFI
jgi:hypothetical protein